MDQEIDSRNDSNEKDNEKAEQKTFNKEFINVKLMFGVVRYFQLAGKLYREAHNFTTDRVTKMLTVPIKRDDWSAEVVLCGLKLAYQTPTESMEKYDTDQVAKVLNALVVKIDDIERNHNVKQRLCKWATILLINHNNNKSIASIEKVISYKILNKYIIDKYDKVSGDLNEMLGVLASSTQLVKYCYTNPEFKNTFLRCFDFVRSLVVHLVQK